MQIIKSTLICLLASFQLFAQEYIDINYEDGIIHIECYGEGQPILIINGGPGMNSQGFRALASSIGENNQAIIYDQRGTGKSKVTIADDSTITMDAMVKDIEVIRNHLKIEEWIVLGHSFGGMLASYYATKHPEPIKGLILSSSGGINMDLFSSVNITSRLTPMQRDSLNYWAAKISAGDTTYHTRLQRGKYLAPAYLYDQSNVPTVAHRLTQANMAINGLVFQDLRKINFDCAPALKQFNKPVLIIQGKNDVVPLSIAEYAHDVLPNSTLTLMDKCGHYGWLDRPELYFGAIAAYLKKHG